MSKQITSFYRWEGSACRVHEDTKGNLSADVYRAGRGILPISIADPLFNGVKISEEQYKELVLEEITLNKEIIGE